MQYFYSPSSNAFFVDEVHGDRMPQDAVPVSDEVFTSLRKQLQSSRAVLSSDLQGNPVVLALAEDTVPSEVLEKRFVSEVQSVLDAVAQSWGYDSVLSAASYKDSGVTGFAAEAKSLLSWRDSVWVWVGSLPRPGAVPLSQVRSEIAKTLQEMPTAPVRPGHA